MLKSLQHKRFTMRNDQLSLPGCHWYVQANSSIEPIGNENDSKHKRPGFVNTGI
jgi:hypothetical protein